MSQDAPFNSQLKTQLQQKIEEAKRDGVPKDLLERLLAERVSESEINAMYAAALRKLGWLK